MTVYWIGGGPGVLSPAAFVELAGTNPPLRPVTGTPVAVRNALTGAPIMSFYDQAGAPVSSVSTLAAGYLSFGVDDVPVVEVSADGWTTVTRLVMTTAITELIAAGSGIGRFAAAFGVPVTDYVRGDGTDETVALQSAVNAAILADRPLVCDGSLTVLVSSPIDMRAHGLHVVGNGFHIRQTGTNIPVVRLGGFQQVITGLFADYQSTPSAADANANAFEWYSMFEGFYANLRAERCGRGFMLAQSGWNGDSVNTCFSTCFTNLFCNGYSIGAIQMKTWPAGGASSTGCSWSNLYFHNNYFGAPAQSADTPWVFQDWDEGHFAQVNIEWEITPSWGDVMFFQRCQNMVFDSLHFEGITLSGKAGLIRPYESTVLNIRGMSYINSTLPADGQQKSIIHPGQGTTAPLRVAIEGLRLRTLTTTGVTGFALADLDGDITTGRFTFDRADTAALVGPHVIGDHPAAPTVQKINDRLFGALAGDPHRVAGQVTTMSRDAMVSNSTPLPSGTLRLTYFTAEDSLPATAIRLLCGGTAAAATPTLIRAGIYSVAKNGDLTLVAAIASDTALMAVTSTAYTRPLSTGGGLPATLPIVAGTRYAMGLLVVSTAATPTTCGQGGPVASEFGVTPRICAALTGQANLPTSIAAGSLIDSPNRFYAAILP